MATIKRRSSRKRAKPRILSRPSLLSVQVVFTMVVALFGRAPPSCAQELTILAAAMRELRTAIDSDRRVGEVITLGREIYQSASRPEYWSDSAYDALRESFGIPSQDRTDTPEVIRVCPYCGSVHEVLTAHVSRPVRNGNRARVTARIRYALRQIPRLGPLEDIPMIVTIDLILNDGGVWMVESLTTRGPHAETSRAATRHSPTMGNGDGAFGGNLVYPADVGKTFTGS